MKRSHKKLLLLRNKVDEKLVSESIFDDFMDSFNRKKEKIQSDKDQYKQRKAEMERLEYVKQGRPIPARLSKANLRAYYTNPAAVPDFLQGGENDPLPTRRYTTGRKASDIEDRIKEKSADFIGDRLGLHPSAKQGLEGAMKTASVTGIASAAAAAYNWFKDTFGADRAKRELPNIEAAAEDAARAPSSSSTTTRSTSTGGIAPLSSMITLLSGIPSDTEMRYIYISDVGAKFDKVYPSRAGENIDEAKIKTMIDGPISDMILGTGRNKLNDRFKTKIPWARIHQNIKNDDINDKTGLGYLSGHYLIVRSRSGGRNVYTIEPINFLYSQFPNFDPSDIE